MSSPRTSPEMGLPDPPPRPPQPPFSSLTGYFAGTPEARAAVRAALVQRPTLGKAALLAPPRTRHYGLVGTAFDYLLRALLVREHLGRTLMHAGSPKLASLARLDFEEGATLQLLDEARAVVTTFEGGKTPLDPEVARACLVLATFDVVIRTGRYHERVGVVDGEDVEDLLRLAEIAPLHEFRAQRRLLLNPLFHAAGRVGGADADLLIDDRLIEIKTSLHFTVRGEYVQQLAGYLALERLGGVAGGGDEPTAQLGVYFARHGRLVTWELPSLFGEQLPGLIAWFDAHWPLEAARGRPRHSAERDLREVGISRPTQRAVPPPELLSPQELVALPSLAAGRRAARGLLGAASEDEVLLCAALLCGCPAWFAPLDFLRRVLALPQATRLVLRSSERFDVWYHLPRRKQLDTWRERALARVGQILSEGPGEDGSVLERTWPTPQRPADLGLTGRADQAALRRLVERGWVARWGGQIMRLDAPRLSQRPQVECLRPASRYVGQARHRDALLQVLHRLSGRPAVWLDSLSFAEACQDLNERTWSEVELWRAGDVERRTIPRVGQLHFARRLFTDVR